MHLQQIAKSVAFAFALVTSTSAFSATDGALGVDSTGEIGVSLSVADRVLISGLDDIPLGSYGGSGELTGASTFCVYRNGNGLYDLTVSSSNASGGTFRAAGGTAFIDYRVRVGDSIDASSSRPVNSGSTVVALSGSGTSTSCGGADNAALEVTFTEAALQAAPTGAFTDVITVLVQPSDGMPVRPTRPNRRP